MVISPIDVLNVNGQCRVREKHKETVENEISLIGIWFPPVHTGLSSIDISFVVQYTNDMFLKQ